MSTPGRMDPDEFRTLGHRMVDWVADYLQRVDSFPVMSRAGPGELLEKLPPGPPEHGLQMAGWDQVFTDLDELVLPGITHWQAPGFFGYFPCSASGPGILGELLSAGLGIQGMLWLTSPAATELETRMLEWLADMLGLPDSFRGPDGGGCIQGTASEATLVALCAARHRLVKRAGGATGQLVAYTSTQGHSSVVKAAMITGLCRDASGGDALRFVPTDGELAMDPAALRGLVAADRAAGRVPFFVCATVGTTSSGAVDPLPAIAAALDTEEFFEGGGWLHVDAAWAGAACICPEHRGMLAGVERADSLCFNPHKWLLCNFDCDAFWTRDRQGLTDALSVTPEYLRNVASDSGAVIDYRDWQVPLGRRFRALKLWFVIRHFGVEGLRAHIRHHVALAERFEALVAADDRFELCAPRRLALVCFRLRGTGPEIDRRNRELVDRVNAAGSAFLNGTTLPLPAPDGPGAFVLRLAIGSPATELAHVEAAWEQLAGLAGEI